MSIRERTQVRDRMRTSNTTKFFAISGTANCIQNEKPTAKELWVSFCGEGGIRTPGGITLNGFQDRRNRPLCHFSGAKVHHFMVIQNLA